MPPPDEVETLAWLDVPEEEEEPLDADGPPERIVGADMLPPM